MATVYLHVGMPKTGTTYLQCLLTENNDSIRKKGLSMVNVGYTFPNISKYRNGHFIIRDAVNEEGKIDEKLNDEIYETCLSNILKEAEKYETLIVSDELIWIRSNNNISRFKKDLDNHGIKLKLIVYLRRQDTFIESYWGQMVKIYTVKTLREYSTEACRDHLQLDFKKQIEYYESILGVENIIVRPYERQQFAGKNNDLLSDFLLSIGYDDIISPADDLPKKGSKSNPSISGIYLETKRVLNYYGAFRSKMNYFTKQLKKLNDLDGDVKRTSNNHFFSYKEKVDMVKRYEEGNNYIAKKYLNQDKLFYDEIKNDDENYSDYTTDDVGRICAKLLSDEYKMKNSAEKEVKKYKAMLEKSKADNRELKKENKKLQSTVDWMSVSFPKKVVRKIKNTLKK